MEILLFLGLLADTERVLDDGGERVAPVSLIDWLAHTMLAVCAGRLEEARGLLEKARPFADRSPAARAALDGLELRRRVTAGDLAGLDAEIARLSQEALRARNPQRYHYAQLGRAWLGALRADAPADLAWPEELPPLIPLHRIQLEYASAWAALRRGEEVDLHPPPAGGPVEQQIIYELLGATRALLARDTPIALERARSAATSGSRARLAFSPSWPTRSGCSGDNLGIALGRADVLADAVATLRHVADAMGSPRARLDAELLEAARAGLLAAPVLEAIAERMDVSPVAARRARALLGAEVRLDSVDALVVRALTGRRDSHRASAEAESRPGKR